MSSISNLVTSQPDEIPANNAQSGSLIILDRLPDIQKLSIHVWLIAEVIFHRFQIDRCIRDVKLSVASSTLVALIQNHEGNPDTLSECCDEGRYVQRPPVINYFVLWQAATYYAAVFDLSSVTSL